MKANTLLFTLLTLLFIACNSQKKMETSSENNLDNSKEMEADFVAMGNEPFWNLEIEFDRGMQFKSLNEPAALTMPVPPAKSKDGSTLSYNISTEDGAMQVTIMRTDCQDSMSGEAFSYSVAIAVKDSKMEAFEQLSGCGRFQGNFRLNDAWALTSMDGKSIDAADFSGEVPNLELQLVTGKVFGFAGCNRFNGGLEFNEKTITFNALASTKMACPQMDVENQFMRAISMQTLGYELADNTLTLKNDAHTLVFSKMK